MEISEYDLHVKIVEEAKAQVEMTVAFWRSRYGVLERRLQDEIDRTTMARSEMERAVKIEAALAADLQSRLADRDQEIASLKRRLKRMRTNPSAARFALKVRSCYKSLPVELL